MVRHLLNKNRKLITKFYRYKLFSNFSFLFHLFLFHPCSNYFPFVSSCNYFLSFSSNKFLPLINIWNDCVISCILMIRCFFMDSAALLLLDFSCVTHFNCRKMIGHSRRRLQMRIVRSSIIQIPPSSGWQSKRG